MELTIMDYVWMIIATLVFLFVFFTAIRLLIKYSREYQKTKRKD